MALTPQSGSSTPSSTSSGLPGESPTIPSDALATMPFISDSALNKFAIDTSTYAETTKQLLGYIKGKRATVTYYRLLNNEGLYNRTNVSDLANARHINHTEYQKIVNFEITLAKEFDFEVDQDKTNVTITGQSMFYPNTNPGIGDMFLMPVGDGRIGLCRVTSVVPTTWRTDRNYNVGFLVQEFLEHGVSIPMEASVTLISYFDKANYFGGTSALLSEQSYVQLGRLKEQRIILSRMFHQMFFDTSRNSYFRPDGLYDPWVVLFMCSKLRMEDVFQRPKNLLGQARSDYQNTIWARLEDSHNNTLYLLQGSCLVRPYDQTLMGVFVTELMDRGIIYTTSTSEDFDPYVFSELFYTSNTTTMSPWELLIYEALTEKTVGSLGSLMLNYIDPVFAAPTDEQFYKIPLCIHLIDMALRSQYREIDAPAMGYAHLDES